MTRPAMKRFLHVIHYPVFGGPTNQALRLAAPLRELGWETLVLLPDEPGNSVERLRAAGVETVTLPLHRLRATPDPRVQARFAGAFADEVRAIRGLIRERGIDLVLVTGLTNPHAGFAARREGTAVTWQLVDTRPPMAMRRALMPVVTRLADSLMTTGREVARVHPGALGFGRRLVPFFPPVDLDAFADSAAKRDAARAEMGIAPDAFVVGTVGNINAQKGHEYLLRAAARAREHVPNLALRILGARTPTQARYEARLRREARLLGFDPGVVFVEPGPRVPALLPAFDLFVLTSVPRSEGIPTAVLEAMAAGLAVVTTDVGAVREAVTPDTGIVVPALRPDAIAAAIGALAGDGGRREGMAAAGRARALGAFSARQSAEAHVRAFGIAMERAARRGGGR
ncbi:MAG: glycosyltransferase [Dehalococcoidia bacterium]|nr:glycosyltransferase [Dehalococcoidia bacterium]